MSNRDLEQLMKKHSLFSFTQPVGYNMTEVDKKIKEYQDALNAIKELVNEKDSQIKNLLAEKERLEKAMTQLNAQLAVTEIPVTVADEATLEKELENFAENEVVSKPPKRAKKTPSIKIIGGGS